MDDSIRTMDLSSLSSDLMQELKERGYHETTIHCIDIELEHLQDYISAKGYDGYTPKIGRDFVTDFFSSGIPSEKSRNNYNALINRLDDCYYGRGFRNAHYSKKSVVPEAYKPHLEAFLDHCKSDNGNSEESLIRKEIPCRNFFVKLYTSGCRDITDITPEIVCRVTASGMSGGDSLFIREMLRFFATEGIIKCDYSTLVPKIRRRLFLPTVYDKDELQAVVGAVDVSMAQGKRDLAIVLLSARLGIRAGDIASLLVGSLDFENNEIRFVQEKTGVPITLVMHPEIKAALRDYLDNGRPDVDSDVVFWGMKAPLKPINRSLTHAIVTKYLKAAGVDIGNRKHGTHSFRSSLASAMVNSGLSYDVARKSLGHSSTEVIKHYAALDAENLRKCAINVPAPSGKFRELLEGRCSND